MSDNHSIAVTQVIYRFWRALDARDYQPLLDLVTEDCRWNRLDQMLVGRDQILASLRARLSNLEIRHIITNVIVTAEGGSLRAGYLLTAFSHVRSEGESAPFRSSPPTLIADVEMGFAPVEGAVLIDSIEAGLVFRAATH